MAKARKPLFRAVDVESMTLVFRCGDKTFKVRASRNGRKVDIRHMKLCGRALTWSEQAKARRVFRQFSEALAAEEADRPAFFKRVGVGT